MFSRIPDLVMLEVPVSKQTTEDTLLKPDVKPGLEGVVKKLTEAGWTTEKNDVIIDFKLEMQAYRVGGRYYIQYIATRK